MTTPSNACRQSGTILIANDHEWTGRSLESLLSAEGYRVIRAFTGQQALDQAIKHRPDAFVLDLTMPDLDGLQVCRALRANPKFGPGTPIIITTAGPAGRQERLNAYRAGAWEFFGQPLDGDAVLLKLSTFIAAKSVIDGLHQESLVDQDTGLYSRRGLLRRGRELASDAARRGLAFAAVVFALDLPLAPCPSAESDRLATRAGEVFRVSGRSADAIGRVGGLEFGLMAVGVSGEQTRQLIKRFSDTALRWRDTADGAPLVLRGGYCVVDRPGDQPIDPERMLESAAAAARGTEVGAEPNFVVL
jgi:CheY-like chemotaxis protein